MDLNLQKLFALMKTVEYGSFTKAAEALSYSQSGISRMIHDLEKDWSVTLLERKHSGITLTSEGIQLFPYVKELCRNYEQLQATVDNLKGMTAGLIRIGTFSSVATHWLPKLIAEFQKDYPNIDYELLLGDYDEIEHWCQEGRVDFGFIHYPSGSGLDTIFLEQDRFMAVLPESHPLAEVERFPMNALKDSPFLLLEKGVKGDVSKLLEQWGIPVQVHFTTWDDYAIMSMVENGLGISILPELILERTPYRIVKKDLETPAFRKIGLAMRDKKNLSLAASKFIAYICHKNEESF